MTEAEWLSCTQPLEMLGLADDQEGRKLRLSVLGTSVLDTLDRLPDGTRPCLVPRDPNGILVDR